MAPVFSGHSLNSWKWNVQAPWMDDSTNLYKPGGFTATATCSGFGPWWARAVVGSDRGGLGDSNSWAQCNWLKITHHAGSK